MRAWLLLFPEVSKEHLDDIQDKVVVMEHTGHVAPLCRQTSLLVT